MPPHYHDSHQRIEAWDGVIVLVKRVQDLEAANNTDGLEYKNALSDLEQQYRLITYNRKVD